MDSALSLSGRRLGFVGLGHMGWPMARHWHEAGAEVVVWNRSPEAKERAAAHGLHVASSLAELADAVGSGEIGINLTTTDVVASVVFGPEGLATALHPEALLMDFGTTGVPATRDFASRVRWLDAPVSGGQVGAESATLTIFVGGREEDFLRARPLMDVLGHRITHLGPAGAGQVAKLANQLIVAQTIDAVAQALRLAELAGLDAGAVREALRGGFADSRILDLHGDRMARRDFVPGGRAALQLKDVRLICELADSLGFDSPTLRNSREQWERFVGEHDGGELDHSGLFRLYE